MCYRGINVKRTAAIMLLLLASCGGEKPDQDWKHGVGIVTDATGAWVPATQADAAPQYAEAISTVKQRLTEDDHDRHRPVVDWQYDVQVRDGDFWIRVFDIYGYFKDGSPAASPGAHRIFVVTTNHVIKKVIPGA